jgi:hypothetical protein
MELTTLNFELLWETQGNTIQKMRFATGTESSDSQNLWIGSRTD